jgi:hypothetical protein
MYEVIGLDIDAVTSEHNTYDEAKAAAESYAESFGEDADVIDCDGNVVFSTTGDVVCAYE